MPEAIQLVLPDSHTANKSIRLVLSPVIQKGKTDWGSTVYAPVDCTRSTRNDTRKRSEIGEATWSHSFSAQVNVGPVNWTHKISNSTQSTIIVGKSLTAIALIDSLNNFPSELKRLSKRPIRVEPQKFLLVPGKHDSAFDLQSDTYLSPEKRADAIAEIMATIALRAVKKNEKEAGKNNDENFSR